MSERVFAYGSNMCSGRFRAYGVSPEGKGVPAVLAGHRLLFNKKSDDESGKANVERTPKGDVWGVLYTISDADLARLARKEVGYVKRKEPVTAGDAVLDAWVFVAANPSADPLQPYSWYRRFLIEGAREHGLPAPYTDALDTIEAIEDSDRERDRRKRAIKCEGGG